MSVNYPFVVATNLKPMVDEFFLWRNDKSLIVEKFSAKEFNSKMAFLFSYASYTSVFSVKNYLVGAGIIILQKTSSGDLIIFNYEVAKEFIEKHLLDELKVKQLKELKK